MKVPARAQKPPNNFPVKVCGDLNKEEIMTDDEDDKTYLT